MSKDQSEVVKTVYLRLIDNESDDWTDLDSNLEIFGWLSDEELLAEVKVKQDRHSKGVLRCPINHDGLVPCFAPTILEAVEAIVSLYDSKGALHEKNRYVLTYYLVMSEMGLIFISN